MMETPERRALRETVRRFVETEVLPWLDEWERAGELHRKAGEIGLLGVGFPESVGGGGDFLDSVAVVEAILSGCRADFVTTAVRTSGPGAHGLSLLVVERGTPGFTVSRKLEKMGWACSDTAELSYVDVRVPAANLIGAEGSGFAQLATQFVAERLSLAVQAYAIARRSLELTLGWCRLRETFGRPLVSRQAVQHKLTEMTRRTDLARVYTRHVAERHVAGDEVIAEACFAKNSAVEAAEWVVSEAVQLHGGAGYLRESEVERHYRDVRILGIGGGTTEILTGLAAKRLGYTG